MLPAGETCNSDPSGCVRSLTGVGSVPQTQAIEDLLQTEGECDGLYGNPSDGFDDFLEVVSATSGDATPSPGTVFAERACESPRLVSLLIVEQFGQQGNPPMPILAFASFFISGCQNEDGFSRTCDLPGGQGQVRLVGFFINILDTRGTVGEINQWSPKRVILTE